MIDIKLLFEQPEKMMKGLAIKNFKGDLEIVKKTYSQKLALMQSIEDLKARQNKISKDIPTVSAEDKKALLDESKDIKEQLKKLEPELTDLEAKLEILALNIPNPALDSVPTGIDDSENKPIKVVGKKPEFDFEPLDHMELGRKLNMIDMEAASNSSGARFYYMKGDGALLELALFNFVLRKIVSKGFTPIIPPVLVKEKAMIATGFFPADKNEIYHVNPDDDDLYLVGTSEVPLCMLHADQILDGDKLPLRYAGYSPCFRREAGSYGKDTSGILRVHQFDKIEMFSFCHPSQAESEHELIRSIEEEVFAELGLHYQVLNICGGDLGAPAAKKYDIEAWIPTQNKFREMTSCSNCTDFQARRAQIRFKKGTEKALAYTLNGTGVTPRAIIAIMENYQQKDGTILIPEVLRPYMDNRMYIGK